MSHRDRKREARKREKNGLQKREKERGKERKI